jgi:Uncharacterized protein conserved in bacteria (DUF2237)
MQMFFCMLAKDIVCTLLGKWPGPKSESKVNAEPTQDGACRSQVSDDFLEYTKEQGNDLSTPRPGFPGTDASCSLSAQLLTQASPGQA